MKRRRSKSTEPLAPPTARSDVAAAFRGVIEYFGFGFELTGRVSFVVELGELDGDPAQKLPGRLADALLDKDAVVHILDLHGKRAAEAEALLENLEGDIAVVFFGKGKGVLRSLFAERIAGQDSWLLLGYSGHTLDEDVPGVGVLIAERTHRLAAAALDSTEAPVRPRSVPASVSRKPRGGAEARGASAAGSKSAARSSRGRSTDGRKALGKAQRSRSRRFPLWKRMVLGIALVLLAVLAAAIVTAWGAVLTGAW